MAWNAPRVDPPAVSRAPGESSERKGAVCEKHVTLSAAEVVSVHWNGNVPHVSVPTFAS